MRQTKMKLINALLGFYERWRAKGFRSSPQRPVQATFNWCVHRVMENGDKISYMMTRPRNDQNEVDDQELERLFKPRRRLP
jgi:hypothetical protein